MPAAHKKTILEGMLSALSGTKRILGAIGIAGGTTYPFGRLIEKILPATITTAGAVTYTASELLGGLILRDPNGAGRSDVTPTAALLAAQMSQACELKVGDSFEFIIRNDADAAETITLTAGTNVTLSGTMTIAQSNSKRFLCRCTAVGATPTFTIYSLGTVVH
jgi:hypothetical protein